MASRIGRKKKNESRLGIVGICAVVVAFGVIMFIKTKDVKEEASDLSKRQQQLEQQLEDEEERAGQLEERKIYVKTKKYVEEVAKSLGLVYPDELIYRPDKN
ncbi:MAG: septum formation initiator family protein [Lachnospiraceae bacterium]